MISHHSEFTLAAEGSHVLEFLPFSLECNFLHVSGKEEFHLLVIQDLHMFLE